MCLCCVLCSVAFSLQITGFIDPVLFRGLLVRPPIECTVCRGLNIQGFLPMQQDWVVKRSRIRFRFITTFKQGYCVHNQCGTSPFHFFTPFGVLQHTIAPLLQHLMLLHSFATCCCFKQTIGAKKKSNQITDSKTLP